MAEHDTDDDHDEARLLANGTQAMESTSPSQLWKLLTCAIVLTIAGVGQGILLPLFISTFTTTTCQTGIETGAYFVLLSMSTLFNIPFSIGCLYDFYFRNTLTLDMMKRHGRILVLMGILDGLNGLLIVFASSLNRVSGDLQAILLQFTIPFTLLFSKLIAGRVVTGPKIVGCGIVMFGIVLAIVPNFIGLGEGKHSNSSFVYPLVFIVGIIPGVLMNVIQHKVFDVDHTYNKNWMLLGESFFQFLTVGALFWADLIPTFGTSTSLAQFGEHMGFGFQCFFNPGEVAGATGRCNYSWMIGSAFAISYCLSYYFGSYLIQHGSANFAAMAAAATTPIQIILWYTISPMREWGCGADYTTLQMTMGAIALPFIVVGAFTFQYFDAKESAAPSAPLEANQSAQQNNNLQLDN